MSQATSTLPPFSMPMFRSFVPERMRPWMYVFLAVTFQFSGGLYLGTLNQMMGETTLMREEVPFHEQDTAVRGGYGRPVMQLACPIHHVLAPALAGVLHRRHVQDTRHV